MILPQGPEQNRRAQRTEGNASEPTGGKKGSWRADIHLIHSLGPSLGGPLMEVASDGMLKVKGRQGT